MARPKKDGKRATGIQGKKGFLYAVISYTVIEDGIKKSEKKWIATGFKDTPENVKKASAFRDKLLNNSSDVLPDRNISISGGIPGLALFQVFLPAPNHVL